MATDITEMKDWTRWVHASITKHFYDTKESNIDFYKEGTLRMDASSIATDLIEVRIDGPMMAEISHNCWKMEVNIGILMITVMVDDDLYRHQVNIGNVVDDMLGTLDIFKYGTPGDDSLAFCLVRNADIITRHFGQPDQAKQLQQSSVEGDYFVTFNV